MRKKIVSGLLLFCLTLVFTNQDEKKEKPVAKIEFGGKHTMPIFEYERFRGSEIDKLN